MRRWLVLAVVIVVAVVLIGPQRVLNEATYAAVWRAVSGVISHVGHGSHL